MPPPEVLSPLRQLYSGDCAIACLSMLTGHPYPYVALMARRLFARQKHHPIYTGLYTTEILRLSKHLDLPLTPIPPKLIDPSDETCNTGILDLYSGKHAHVVVLFKGLICDPADGFLWDYDTFTAVKRWKVSALLAAL